MKIQSSSTTPSIDTTSATGGSTRSEGRKSAAATPASGAGRDAGTVRIDPRASLLAAAEASLENVAAVDSARVDEIKRAIAEGRFEVDSRRVAERLVGSVRDLILTRGN